MGRNTSTLIISIVFVMSVFSLALPAKKNKIVALVGATVVDGTGAAPAENTTLIIEGEKIKAIGPSQSVAIPEEAEQIDASGKWILPGFIDLHIHLTYPQGLEMYSGDSGSFQTIRALSVMDKMLRAGITSVRDVASNLEPMQAIQVGVQQGYIDSIRVFSVGEGITSTGGHGEILSAVRAADGPDEWRKAVREIKKAGFEYVKLLPPFTLEEATAAVEEAMSKGMRITSHGGGASDTDPPSMTRIAIEAGVQCIEHPPKMSDGTLALMAEKGVHWVPTMSIYRLLYMSGYKKDLIKLGWSAKMHEDLFLEGRRLGLTIGIGTDFVGSFTKRYPKPYFEEMRYYEELGVSRMETIVCGTKNGGIILGKEEELGTLEPGKLADLQMLSKDPLEALENLGNPELVMVGGRIHRFTYKD
jgi:imidazolonepropionase-like amidohydrolase